MIQFEKITNTETHPEMTTEEKVIYTARIHWISFVKPIIFIIIGLPFLACILAQNLFGTILFLIGIYLGGVKGLLRLLDLRYTRIYVRENLLTIKTGILTKNMQDISLRKYKALNFSKSVLGRALDFGRFSINTGEFSSRFTIAAPEGLRQAIIEQTNKYSF